MSNLTCSYITTDANSAVASVAYRLNEIIAIYPITPSSSMAEQADIWAANNRKNIWQDIPKIIEMQSEAGAIATVHGALQTGALATSFTSSQGLLLMIPTLYKLAGQLQPFVLHVAARTVATHALSIFGDHSDVMAVRQTGCAMLCANHVQQAQDFAVIAQIAALNSRLPFIHFFDGFRTSHEINKIQSISDNVLQKLIPYQAIREHRQRALSPEAPTIRGTAANPDTYFQALEAINPWYFQAYQHVLDAMQTFGNITGRYYQPFEYYGHPDAEQIIILMGSAAGPCEEVIDQLLTQNEKVGMVKVHLFRPFSAQHFLKVVPLAVKSIAVLDRTKEPGAQAEPLFLDIMTALAESFSQGLRDKLPNVISGRYGLSSKEFDPDCVITIFHQLKLAKPKTRFTIGIHDDVTGLSLPIIKATLPTTHKLAALFYGLGSDGSVSATKNTIKLIGNHTPLFPQGYFVYDYKAGGLTVSHLRINHQPFYSSYLIKQADFIGCHQWQFIHKYQLIEKLKPGGIFLINSPYKSDQIWHHLPQEIQYLLRQKQAQCYTINAYQIARQCQLGGRINTIMQTAFFYLTQLLPMSEAKQQLKEAISQSYRKKGANVVENNLNAIDLTIKAIEKIDLQQIDITSLCRSATVAHDAPDFVKNVTAKMLADLGDTLPVSVFPPDGCWPTGTTKWEKRNIAETIPIWLPDLCTQCNYCVAACPHAAIRAKVTSAEILKAAPASLPSLAVKSRDMREHKHAFGVSIAAKALYF